MWPGNVSNQPSKGLTTCVDPILFDPMARIPKQTRQRHNSKTLRLRRSLLIISILPRPQKSRSGLSIVWESSRWIFARFCRNDQSTLPSLLCPVPLTALLAVGMDIVLLGQKHVVAGENLEHRKVVGWRRFLGDTKDHASTRVY